MVRNDFQLQMKTISWRIKNFSMCPQLPGESIFSPDFSLDSSGMTNLTLNLYPRGNGQNNEYISFSITGRKSDYVHSSDAYVHVFLKIVPEEKNKCLVLHPPFLTCFKLNQQVCYECPKLVERKVLMEHLSTLSKDRLNLLLMFYWPPDMYKIDRIWTCNKIDMDKLSSDLKEAFGSKDEDYDLVLKGPTGGEFQCHKIILISRYPKLADALGLQKNRNQEFCFETEYTPLYALMKYLYCGTSDFSIDIIFDYLPDMLDSGDPSHLRNLPSQIPYFIKDTTTVQVRHGVYIWEFPNFSEIPNYVTLKQDFSCSDLYNWTIRVLFCFRQNEESEQCVAFYVERIVEKNLYTKCKISVVGTAAYEKECDHVFGVGEHKWQRNTWKVPNLIPKKFLMDNKDTLLLEDILRIKLEFKLSYGMFTSEMNSASFKVVTDKQNNGNLWALQQDFLKLYKNPVLSDVTLCVEHEKLSVHKFILSARSAVFREMFKGSTYKNTQGTVVIKDFDASVIKALLSYMYAGQFDKNISVAFISNLYAAASRYQVLPLKQKCAGFLGGKLSVQNSSELLQLADDNSDEALKKYVHNFVCCNTSEVFNSVEWKKLMREKSDLAAEVLSVVSTSLAR